MNPRGRQYSLGGTLTSWTVLGEPTRRQRLALRSAYAGVNPQVYSRYGHRQWAAPLPGTRVVVKDPFALLSMATVQQLTGARPVVLVRHPAAVLLSYRRMGWSPDTAEVQALARAHLPERASRPDGTTQGAAFGWFWSVLHDMALPGMQESGAVVVFHEDLASGGEASMRILAASLGLDERAEGPDRTPPPPVSPPPVDPARLHNLNRDPASVAGAWRGEVSDAELESLEDATSETMSALSRRRLDVTVPRDPDDPRRSRHSPGRAASDS